MVDKNKPNLCRLGNILFRIDRKVGYNQNKIIGMRPASEVVEYSNVMDGKYKIYFHCAKHPSFTVDLLERNNNWVITDNLKDIYYNCPVCGEKLLRQDSTIKTLECEALSFFNADIFKDVELIKTDDFYTPEIKIEMKGDKINLKSKNRLPEGYKIIADIKKDKDLDTIVMLQIFKSGKSKGAQLFIKPEKGQLTSDHNNPEPAEFISEINVKLKNKDIIHKLNQDK